MQKSVEFDDFYKLLEEVKVGNEEKNKELEWMLAEYEHAKDSSGAFDELGQIFCHIGVMELYEYTGLDNLQIISSLEESVWKYLRLRMGTTLSEYMLKSMLSHSAKHKLTQKISGKWDTAIDELEENLEGLARYVIDGIVEVVANNQ